MNVAATPPAQRFRCSCPHLLQVHGGGRHRRSYQLDDSAWRHPVMTRAYPSCRRPLPARAGHDVRRASRHWYRRSSAPRRVTRRVAESVRPHRTVGRG
jgi:hypothetical protein